MPRGLGLVQVQVQVPAQVQAMAPVMVPVPPGLPQLQAPQALCSTCPGSTQAARLRPSAFDRLLIGASQ